MGAVMINPTMDNLVLALLDGNHAAAVEQAKMLRDSRVGCEQIITEGVEAAMTLLDAKCTVEQFNLLEIMLAGRAVMGVIKELYPPNELPLRTKATVVVGALEGDVHDLGKNVFKAVLMAKRYRVVDCGKDCPSDQMLETVEREAAQVLAISGLITTVIPQVRALRHKLVERGLGHVTLMAGGAALKQASATSLNVDFVADTAFGGLHYLEQITGDGQ
jgi:methanogenic corrinoid protein MtbC1